MNVRTAVLLSLAFCSAQAQDQPVMPKADLIFVHGNVYTGVVEASSFKSIKRAQAIAVRGDRIEAICRELGCSKSWWYKWKTRYEAPEPTWSQEHSRRPRTTPTKTPAAVDMAIVRLRGTLSPGVSAQVIRDHLSRHHIESLPSRRTIYRILKRHPRR